MALLSLGGWLSHSKNTHSHAHSSPTIIFPNTEWKISEYYHLVEIMFFFFAFVKRKQKDWTYSKFSDINDEYGYITSQLRSHKKHKNKTSHSVNKRLRGTTGSRDYSVKKGRCFACKDLWYMKGKEFRAYLVKSVKISVKSGDSFAIHATTKVRVTPLFFTTGPNGKEFEAFWHNYLDRLSACFPFCKEKLDQIKWTHHCANHGRKDLISVN